MYFNKYPHPANFTFASGIDSNGFLSLSNRKLKPFVDAYEGDIFRLRVGKAAAKNPNGMLSDLNFPRVAKKARQPLQPGGQFALATGKGTNLSSASESWFGVDGDSWITQFVIEDDAKFFGMGEKNFNRYELSGIRTKFYNTDVWGDFHYCQYVDHPADPSYAAIPYLVIKQKDCFIGILVNSAFPVFMETPGDAARTFVSQLDKVAQKPSLIIGAEGGECDLVFIVADTLKELTRKYQKLIGTTPVPPLWSLGYHQCRWGYKGEEDLLMLDENFKKIDFPADALWLDIDYMEGYRVFTYSKEHFPHGPASAVEKIAKSDRRVIPILDPGVKRDPGYSHFDTGLKANIFCQNREGNPYVGIVWPGETVFPDFMLKEGRDWWADRAADFRKIGFGGAWVDMNDVSTGSVDPSGMLFRNGKDPHIQHRNQYALGMQMATHQGFLQAQPNERPFILSRSASTGTAKYSAVWTGDNFSNEFYLQCSVPTSLNLSISGIPFNGPDVGGFGGASTEPIMTTWIKSGFLFPFLRNHNGKGTLEEYGQEPWRYSQKGMELIRKFVRLRYRLLPYLYSLYHAQERHGDPIMRPLNLEFGKSRTDLDHVKDQFMVGPFIMQAPQLKLRGKKRSVIFPGRHQWFDAADGTWQKPGKRTIQLTAETTPFYLHEGAIIPMQAKGEPIKGETLLRPEILIVAHPQGKGKSLFEYFADDGLSFDYQKGKQSKAAIQLEWGDGVLDIRWLQPNDGYGKIAPKFLVVPGFKTVHLNGKAISGKSAKVELVGKPVEFIALDPMDY